MNQPETKITQLEARRFKSENEVMRDKLREKRKQTKLNTAMKRKVKIEGLDNAR